MEGLWSNPQRQAWWGLKLTGIEKTPALKVQTYTHTWAGLINGENNKSHSVDVIKPSIYQFVAAQDALTHFSPKNTQLHAHMRHSWILFIMMSISMSDRKVKGGEQLHKSPEVWQTAFEVYGCRTLVPS